MLHRKNTTYNSQNQNKPLWTQEESIAYECAKEVMNDMAGICSALIAQEKAKSEPNSQRLEELYRKRLHLLEERDSIHWYDKELISKIRREYGTKIKAYREGGKCPL